MSRFVLEKSVKKENSWVCKDNDSGIICVFEDKKFNDTQELFRTTELSIDHIALARINREMADWLFESHREKLY